MSRADIPRTGRMRHVGEIVDDVMIKAAIATVAYNEARAATGMPDEVADAEQAIDSALIHITDAQRRRLRG